ncbi:MAG: DUF1566 domain-containing protein, partial [Candidatus Nitrotoga sp.]
LAAPTQAEIDVCLSMLKTRCLAAKPTQAEIDAPNNSVGFRNAVNTTNLCGFNDWRLPTADELRSIVKFGSSPSINTTWLPNTQPRFFWSASPFGSSDNIVTDRCAPDVVGSSDNTWGVNFGDGNVGVVNGRYSSLSVRLVRTGQ